MCLHHTVRHIDRGQRKFLGSNREMYPLFTLVAPVRYRNDLSVARMKKFIVRRLTINRSIKASLIKDQFVLWDHGAILVRKINETLLVILAQRSVEEVFS